MARDGVPSVTKEFEQAKPFEFLAVQ